GRMLTRDLNPFGSPTRGQALLESWNEALKSQLKGLRAQDPEKPDCAAGKVDTAGLAIPLSELTGGRDRAPTVYINSTNALDGQRVWFSNDMEWRTKQRELTPSATFSALPVTVGEALLHGARFPIISPTGMLPPHAEQTLLLVDGGYADNSGASSLFKHPPAADILWINIDGNPIHPLSGLADRKEAQKGFTPIRGLLAVRTSQATNAIERASDPASKICPLSVALERSKTNVDPCLPLQKDPAKTDKSGSKRDKNRLAPLGWFITQKTAEDMDCALVQAVDRICARFGCTEPTRMSQAFELRRTACSLPAAPS